jgi:tRNA pseudouridine38-40 synthase
VASFVVDDDVALEKLQRSVNSMLAPEVVAWDVRRAPEGFNARFSATAREYRYRIGTGAWPDPFEGRFVWHRPGALAVPPMRAAARALLGEHDFASFCRRPPSGGTVRRLERLSVARAGDRVEISARANAFLHQMVRALVGTLVAVGDGRLEFVEVPKVLAARDRARTPQMAPAHGLTLERVVYGRRGSGG